MATIASTENNAAPAQASAEVIELSRMDASRDAEASREQPNRLPDSAADAILEESRRLDAEAPDGGLQSWMMVGCCSVLAFWYVGTTYSWGVLQGALVERHLAPASTLAFVGSLAIALLSVFAIINSRLLVSIGARTMATIGAVFMGLSQILAGFATHNIAGLFVTAGVMMGIGVSLCFIVISITPGQWFSTKRGTAVGVVYGAGGLGGAVLSLAMEASVRRFGPEWTFRGVGLLLLATCIPAAWMIKERTIVTRKTLIDWSLFRSPDFVVLFFAGALATFPILVSPFFLPMYAQSLHMPASSGAVLVCLFNFSSAVGRIITGLLSDRVFGPLNTLFLSLAMTALTLVVLWPTSTTMAPLVVFVLLNGACNGGFFSIMPTVVGNLLGSQRLGVAFGMIVTGWVGGYLMGAPIAGYILAAYGGTDKGAAAFRPAVFWAGGMATAAAALVAFLRLKKSKVIMRKM